MDRSSNSIHNSATKTPNSNRRSFQPKSRVLDEAPQSWMMRTTYISNDGSRKILDFTSASTIKKRSAMEVDKKMEETKAKTQTYDLDVVPLKDENSPHINFLLVIDEEKQMVRYHPVSSRVQLSTGRPSRPDKSIIEKRTLSESDVQDIEMRVAEVDKDLEDKYAVDGNSGDEDDDHYVGKGAQENMDEKDDDSEDGF